MNNSNESAFPLDAEYIKNLGLTKREYFAGLAMQGILANENINCNANLVDIQVISKNVAMYSTQMADSLLEQLEK